MRSITFALALYLAASASFASGLPVRNRMAGPPVPPLPVSVGASRGDMLGAPPAHRLLAAQDLPATPNPSQQTVLLPLSAGLSMISIPLRTGSQTLSDLLPNLPDGSRIWTWHAATQEFIEGFDQQLPFGQGAFLYLPSPSVIVINGEPATSSAIPVELANGWNLVGVPYTTPLARSSQVVYVSSQGTPFNDAVDQGAIVEPVFTLDRRGYTNVEADDSFEPMRAYWVYSNGADLLEIRPVRLEGLAKDLAWWTAEQAGSAVAGWAMGELLASLSPDPNQPILDKLDKISGQIAELQATQQRILDQFAVTQGQIKLSEAEILGAVGEVNVRNVRADVAAHFDDDQNQNASFLWFEKQAKTDAGRKLITDANRIAFANNVLNTWNFSKQFNDVVLAIAPNNAPGVLDNFADRIVLSGAQNSTLRDRYKAMELYFAGLVGLQVKIMTLLTNSWNTLAKVPGSGYSADFADQWRKGTYRDALVKETYRFRDAAEKIIAANLRVSSAPGDAPVSIPPEIADTILPSLDFGVMKLADEAPGVRVRVFVGRYLNEPDTYTIVDRNNATILPLPSADSGLWKTLPAGTSYDAWRVRNNPASFTTDSTPEFYIDKYWIMYRATLPLTLASGLYQLRLVDKWGITDDNETPALYGLRSVRVGTVDANNNPSTTGTLFGSVILAKRAAARTMLRIYNDGKSSVWDNCKPSGQAKFGKEHDYFIISGNCYGGGWAGYQRIIPFYFAGPPDSAPGDWQMGLQTKIGGGCAVSDCSQYSLGHIELLDNDRSAVSIVRHDSATQISYASPVTWQKNHTYKFQMRLVHTGTSNGVASQVWRGPLVIRFNP